MAILDTAKTVYDLAKAGATLELQEELMKIREEALALQEECLSLRQQISDFQKSEDERNAATFDGTVYWKQDASDQKDGPFCQRCFDVDKILVRLQDGSYHDGDRQVKLWDCKACKTSYEP